MKKFADIIGFAPLTYRDIPFMRNLFMKDLYAGHGAGTVTLHVGRDTRRDLYQGLGLDSGP